MIMTNVAENSIGGLPDSLRTAQAAIHLPEVQEMLRKLSQHNLGIYMPHMHDQHTGAFQRLADEIGQVESGLAVSFRQSKEVASQADRFLPIGWCWRGGAMTVTAACEMIEDANADNPKHNMPPQR